MAEGDFPVFVNGVLQGNLTSAQGQAPVQGDAISGFEVPIGGGSGTDAFGNPVAALPALPSTFAPSQTSAGNVVTSQGAASTGAMSLSPTGGAGAMPSNAQAGAQPAASGSGIASGSLADYFFRAVVIILGFIFVAIGLNMFKPGIVPVPGLRRV